MMSISTPLVLIVLRFQVEWNSGTVSPLWNTAYLELLIDSLFVHAPRVMNINSNRSKVIATNFSI